MADVRQIIADGGVVCVRPNETLGMIYLATETTYDIYECELKLTPKQARNLAALLLIAANKVEKPE
jgi:hypothetical protein